ncbi:MAG: hypothetical protein IPK71_06700 [Myxococcales bacterium]|nr:hypothetical protein [Myxococcales bacterium]
MKKRIILAALLAFSGTIARPASATPSFPGAIRGHLGLGEPPPCALCHAGGQTGRGTVTTPFGATMRSRGLVAYDESTLRTALDALAAEKKDSDHDGVPDVAELTSGADPNAAGGDGGVAGEAPPVPEYGCAAAPGEAAHTGSGVALGIALAFAGLVRSKARPRA